LEIPWQYLLRIHALMYKIQGDHQGATHSVSTLQHTEHTETHDE